MLDWGFCQLPIKPCVYYWHTSTSMVIVVVHVDDFLLIASSKEENERFKDQMRTAWTISDMGDV